MPADGDTTPRTDSAPAFWTLFDAAFWSSMCFFSIITFALTLDGDHARLAASFGLISFLVPLWYPFVRRRGARLSSSPIARLIFNVPLRTLIRTVARGVANTTRALRSRFGHSHRPDVELAVVYCEEQPDLPQQSAEARLPALPINSISRRLLLSPEGPQSGIESTVPRRKRTTKAQAKVLEEGFAKNTKPDINSRSVMAQQLDMTTRGVQVWFQNRRAMEKNIKRRAEAQKEDAPRGDSSNASFTRVIRPLPRRRIWGPTTRMQHLVNDTWYNARS